MAHLDTESEPLVSAPSSSTHATRYDGWTIEKQVGFLRMLAATQSVARAAQSVGMGRQSAYKLRVRLSDQPFGAAWRMAMRSARDTLVEAAIDRAVNGVEVPHYWKGELIGTSRRYDERLTALLLTSGALDKCAPVLDGAERHYAADDFSVLIERIELGSAYWGEVDSENDFVLGNIVDASEIEPLEDGKSDESAKQ